MSDYDHNDRRTLTQAQLDAMEARLLHGITGIHDRLDILNGRTRKVENDAAATAIRLAALEDVEKESRRITVWDVTLAASVATAIGGIVYFLRSIV